MSCQNMLQNAALKKIRTAATSSELLIQLRENLDREMFVSADLFLYSEDLNSFFFPPNVSGEPDENYRTIFNETCSTPFEFNPSEEHFNFFLNMMAKGCNCEIELLPLQFKEWFLGFLFLAYKPTEAKNDAAHLFAQYVASICESVLNLQIKEQIIEKYRLENEVTKNSLVRAENLKMLGEMIGGITHDFNNIFTGVIGYGQLIEMMSEDEDTRDSVSEILSAANAGKERIKFIQDTKKISHDEPPVELNIPEVIRESAKGMDILLPSYCPHLTSDKIFEYDFAETPMLPFPKIQLKQFFTLLFESLIKNGAKKISVKSGMNDLKMEYDISYEKTGSECVSIPLNAESSADFPGCLVLHQTADRLKFKFHCKPGLIKVEFKLRDEPLRKPDVSSFAGKKVLVYEKDPQISGFFNSIFRYLNVESMVISEACRLKEILESGSEKFDIAILDIGAYPVLKSLNGAEGLPEIAITSSWGPLLDLERLDGEFIKRIVLKPFTIEEIIGLLE
ncbi:MAG: hypothetical protein LWY06_14695 [Firmicutes bacterium]|nr:hypothetical protein [Bacillota bacterium]